MGFTDLNQAELEMIDGGINWDRVFGGVSLCLGSTLTLVAAATTGPIGMGVVGVYWATCGVSGAYIGYGLVS